MPARVVAGAWRLFGLTKIQGITLAQKGDVRCDVRGYASACFDQQATFEIDAEEPAADHGTVVERKFDLSGSVPLKIDEMCDGRESVFRKNAVEI